MAYTVNYDERPYVCFPDDLDTSGFVNVSKLGDKWATFVSPDGETHSCEQYNAIASSFASSQVIDSQLKESTKYYMEKEGLSEEDALEKAIDNF